MVLEWLFSIPSKSRKSKTYKIIWDVDTHRGTCGWLTDSGEWAYSSGASVGPPSRAGDFNFMFTIRELFEQIKNQEGSYLINLSVDTDEIPEDILLDLVDMLAVEGISV